MTKSYYVEINDPNQQPMLGCLRDDTPHTIWLDDVSKKTHTKKQIKNIAERVFTNYMEDTYFNIEQFGEPYGVNEDGEYIWLNEDGDPNDPDDFCTAEELMEPPVYGVTAELWYSGEWHNRKVCDLDWTS